MRKLESLALVAFAVLALSTAAYANPEAGDVGVFFNPEGTISALYLPEAGTFNFYTVAFGIEFHSGFEYSVTPDPNIVVNTATPNPEGSLTLGSGNTYVVAMGTCILSGGGKVVLHCFEGASFTPVDDMLICLSAAGAPYGTLFHEGNPVPGYYVGPACQQFPPLSKIFTATQNGQGIYPNACAVVNPQNKPPIATEQVSWGAVKGDF